jgi:hypothetical protein
MVKLAIAQHQPIGYNDGRFHGNGIDEPMPVQIKRPESAMDPGLQQEKPVYLASFTNRAQALGAELRPDSQPALQREGGRLDVWPPHAAGAVFRVADIVAKRGLFAAKITLCHFE